MSYTPTEWESTDVVTATRLNALEQAVGDLNMSYTPNVWQNGDILTADKMNALEQAVASGGGGSSDFSIATVTVTSDYGDIELSNTPCCYDADEYYEGFPAMLSNVYLESYTRTVRVPLYKGLCIWSNQTGYTASVTGDIVYDDGWLFITGDGTVTFTHI